MRGDKVIDLIPTSFFAAMPLPLWYLYVAQHMLTRTRHGRRHVHDMSCLLFGPCDVQGDTTSVEHMGGHNAQGMTPTIHVCSASRGAAAQHEKYMYACQPHVASCGVCTDRRDTWSV